MLRFITLIARGFLRLFMPGIAAALREERQLTFTTPGEGDTEAPSTHIDVEDNGADTTLVTFAGMAVLYAAMPKFEFKQLLTQESVPLNFVFVRDVFRSSYRCAPDGSGDGLAFYERAVTDALTQLRSRRTIALGMSGGGEAAMRISGAAPIDGVIAFNPAFPLERYGAWKNILRVVADIRKLVRSPGAYLEVVLVTLGARYLWSRTGRLAGHESSDAPLQDYLRRRVPATVFYSEHSLPDLQQAQGLRHIPEITLKPLDSARHNCIADLKKQGDAAAFLQEQVRVMQTTPML